ncbi:MAG: hypothetical protein ACI9WC_003068 [Arenicella sp.]|jgi:hypothetical protein
MLVSKDAIGGDLAGQKFSIDVPLKTVACDSFIFQSGRFDKYALLDAMSSRTSCKNTASDRRKGSYYRATCDYIKRLKRVCLVTYDADLVAPEGFLMLARVTSFAKRNDLLFSTIFIGNTTRIRRTRDLSEIEIDRFMARCSSNK